MPPTLAQLLSSRRDDIVARFVSVLERREVAPPDTARSALVDHVPSFVDSLAAEVASHHRVGQREDPGDSSSAGRDHGADRFRHGYDLDAIVREYGVLRHAILDLAKEEGVAIGIDEFDVLAKCINVAVAEAVSEYARHRDEELAAKHSDITFLIETSELLGSSLDYQFTMTKLTRLVVPRLADWCAIHLEEGSVDDMPIAHTDPAKVEVLRDLYRRFPLPPDADYGWRKVCRTGVAELVPSAEPAFFAAHSVDPGQREAIQTLGTCSWLIVPLRVQNTVFGALTLAFSDSGRHYAATDLAIANELARRAAAAIDNAKLYLRSQAERSRVEAATRAKDEFVAMVSHELRTPLNAILGWTQLLRSGTLPAEKHAHALEVIERNAKSQSQLVADLLDVSRVITGTTRISVSRVDLADVVDIVLEGVRPAAEAKRITIEVDLERKGSVLRGDAERLQQVAWILLTNAVKFTAKGGTVGVRLRPVDSEIELVVADDGEGISPSFLPHVFETFRQSDGSSARQHGGLGVGLSIAKHLVELHGGSLRAASDGVGKGATFTMSLPTAPLAAVSIRPKSVAATKVVETELVPRGLDGLRVLVVDDEPDARELLGVLLETSGVEVALASSAAEALTALASFDADVVISDIGMPVEDGYSLIRSIRTLADEDKRNVPAIALTAYARNEDRTRALVEGFNHHMTKPVEPAALVAALVDLAGFVPRAPSAG